MNWKRGLFGVALAWSVVGTLVAVNKFGPTVLVPILGSVLIFFVYSLAANE